MQVGSHGVPEFVYSYPDFKYLHHTPVALYHMLYLGPGKQTLRQFTRRLKEQPARGTAAWDKAPKVQLFQRPALIRSLFTARLKHVVLRSAPTCTLLDPQEFLTEMTIAETQLFYEVFLPYLLHDVVNFGIPESFVLMWYDSSPRHPGRGITTYAIHAPTCE
jgi:hypothetical protein